jgi:phospholipase/carboxylesterase
MRLKGPELAAKNGERPKQLIMLLHGMGKTGEELSSIAQRTRSIFPDAYFICPNAPYPHDESSHGYQWFSTKDLSEPALLKGLNNSMRLLNELVNYQLNRFQLKENNLAVVGVSQGSMVALHTFLRRPSPVASLIGFSGTIVSPYLLNKELKSKPNVLLVHGKEDPIIPFKYLRLTYKSLLDLGINVKTKVYPSLGHTVNLRGVVEAIRFISSSFSSKN